MTQQIEDLIAALPHGARAKAQELYQQLRVLLDNNGVDVGLGYPVQVVIDTPYVTVAEFARRAGLSERTVRHKVGTGELPICEKAQGSKSSVLINMVQLALRAAQDGKGS